ncbi:MAG: LPXTG-motif cell wall-anchored protein [Arcobacteraceae bacterium]|jgi:LPXTG-motif cell wall-anchored protein
MATLDIVMFVFLGLVLVGGLAGFFIYNNREE